MGPPGPGGAPLSFGARLRACRVRAGLSQETLAQRAGLAVATLKALELDKRQRPHPRTLALLVEALGLDPEQRDALLDTLHSSEHAPDRPVGGRPGGPPATEQPVVDAARLPVWLTSFVGREVEIEMVRALLDPSTSAVRLVTLLGPGGIGKTRLAVRAATELFAVYPDGVVFIDLSPLTDGRLVPTTLARALGLRERRGRAARELLLDYLRPLRRLLLLENVEHVLSAVPLLAEVLRECPHVALLVTSRTALQLTSERRLRVDPLSTPDDELSSLAQVEASPAVRLFVDRAQAVASDFTLDASNAAAIAAICRRVDGIPLAIELAAARIGLLQPAELLQRLDRRLPLLASGAPDLPERQQTMRATLDWSYRLLDPANQLLFRRLAVFPVSSTLEAAETVCEDAQRTNAEVLDGMQELVDSSLLRLHETGHGRRFGMLETIREYAREQLIRSGELERLRAAHATYFSRMAEPAASAQTSTPWIGGQSPALTDAALDRLATEFDNLEAALDWWVTDGRHAEGLRLAIALSPLWSRRGHYAAGRRWLETMLDLVDRRTASASSRTMPDAARLRVEQALGLMQAGALASSQGDNGQARAFHRRSVEIFREQNHAPGLAVALANLGLVEWVAGEPEQAVVLLEEALARSREANLAHTVAISLRNLGMLARSHGNYAHAQALFSAAAAQPLPSGWFRDYSLVRSISCLGRVAHLQDDLPRARELFKQAFEVLRQSGVTGQALADCLDWQAALEAQEGELVRAARLFGAADNHWRTSGAHRYLPDEAAYLQDLAAVQATLDGHTFVSAWTDGAAMQPGEAIDVALTYDERRSDM